MRSRTLQSACALSRDKFVALSVFAESGDEDVVAHEVLFVEGYRRVATIGRQGQYVRIARVAAASDTTALLAREGTVEYLSFAGESRGYEDITGAIAGGKTMPPLDFLLSIACIDDKLFACGMGGQVYARGADGKWTSIAPGLRTTDPYQRWFSNIQGLDRDHVFVDGLSIVANRSSAALYVSDGTSWKPIATGTDAAIGEMVFVDAETIYIAGARSTLLVGNARDGFHPIRVSARDLELYTICRYRDDIFIGTGEGLFRLQRSRDGLLAVDGDGIDGRDILSLQVVDDVMWCFGLAFIRRFDGERWERFDQVF